MFFQEWRKIYGESADEIGDLRDKDKVFPGLGACVWSYLSDNAARMWRGRKS